jgi:hypothetical protein
MPVAHLLGVAHSITSHERGAHANPTDAFVNCTIYMAKLLHRAGWTVYVYAVEGSVVPECTEVVAVVSRATYDATYATRDDQALNTFSDCSVATWIEGWCLNLLPARLVISQMWLYIPRLRHLQCRSTMSSSATTSMATT